MRPIFRKTLAFLLSASLMAGCAVPAFASFALGEDMKQKDTLLNEGTQLSSNVFWSTTYSDLRTENLITYLPNEDVRPIVTFGESLTKLSTTAYAAAELEQLGYRVVAGINGDFFNTSTGLPVGIVVTDGQLRSSDGGYAAIGFRRDGTAIIGKPTVKVHADLGYVVADTAGYVTEVERQLSAVNKSRVSTGGIFLYTYDFNAKHTTGTTEPGVDVVCTVESGSLRIGEETTLRVEQVLTDVSATPIQPNQVVLSVNNLSNSYYVDALRNIPEGREIRLTVTAADEAWNEVEYAVGALYTLLTDGQTTVGLPSGSNPRTAVGQKADGTLVFYTIDGRNAGYSIGASMSQIAARLVELGCVNAVCMDGGGSTTLTVTSPDATAASTVNRPSDGSLRAVSNQIFLVASARASGKLSHYYVAADHDYVLAGSKVNLTASAVDTNYIPMSRSYTLTADGGSLTDQVLTTPEEGGTITVTASGGGKSGETTVHAIADPDKVTIRNSAGNSIGALTVTPGSSTQLKGSAVWNHITLFADPEVYHWSVSGNIGSIDDNGRFAAGMPGSGSITLTAANGSVTIPVTVSQVPLKTLENFEDGTGSFSGSFPNGAVRLAQNRNLERVAFGTASLEVSYDLEDTVGASCGMDYTLNVPYNQVNLWVYGDNSGNSLYFDLNNDETAKVCRLNYAGWKQWTVALPEGADRITGLEVRGEVSYYEDELTGDTILVHDTASSGILYLDQLTASYGGIVDNEAPRITLRGSEEDPTKLTGQVTDDADGLLSKSAITVSRDGSAVSFSYNSGTGSFSVSAASDGGPHRITVTAVDASGNIGRASYDVPMGEDWEHLFVDTQDYWAADYVDFLYTSGITTGYADGTFRPNQNISRQQFAVMLFRYLKLDGSKYENVVLPFADNDKIGDYARNAVQALYTEGIINGSTGTDGKIYFNPGNSLTRAQAATIIGRIQPRGYDTVALSFTDRAKIPAYATYYIQTMVAQGIISGYADGTFKPNNNITRGQMAKILYNLM